MDFCNVSVHQIDDKTAEIRTVINTDTLLVMVKKKMDVADFYSNLEKELRKGLDREFDMGTQDEYCESLENALHRAHKGYTNQFHSFVSVLTIATIKSDGGGLTKDLTEGIIRTMQDALKEEPPKMDREEVIAGLVLLSEKISYLEDKTYKNVVDRAIELLRV